MRLITIKLLATRLTVHFLTYYLNSLLSAWLLEILEYVGHNKSCLSGISLDPRPPSWPGVEARGALDRV